MRKEWYEMNRKELEEAFKTGTILPGPGPGEKALQRLRILWRREDSRLAWIAIILAGLTFLVTAGWLIWTLYMWFSKD